MTPSLRCRLVTKMMIPCKGIQSGFQRETHTTWDCCCILIYFVVPFYANWGQPAATTNTGKGKIYIYMFIWWYVRIYTHAGGPYGALWLLFLRLLLVDKILSLAARLRVQGGVLVVGGVALGVCTQLNLMFAFSSSLCR